jgi:hypothetical protein
MKKNAGRSWRRIHGLGIVRLPRVVLPVIVLVVSAGIPLAIPGSASAQQGPNSDLQALEVANHNISLPPTVTSVQMMLQARLRNASWMSSRISQRMRSRRNQ